MGQTAPAVAWEPPRSFDSFVIERPLGVGGMGHVYLGRDAMLDRKVALKFIASDVPTVESRERFLIEARAIAKLQHPNVVGVFRIGEVEGKPYIAYEFVDGASLDCVARPVTWTATLRIATQLARGLEAAHRAGIVHRDVKPSNVMLSSNRDVKILDFGIAKLDATGEDRPRPSLRAPSFLLGDAYARTEAPAPGADDGPHTVDLGARPERAFPIREKVSLTRTGALIGTPAFLAPELWAGESATPRSDVFAVGLVLYELLTGSLPFAPLAGVELADAVVERDVPSIRSRRPELPPAFAMIIDRCLRRHPLARYEDAAELRADLERVSAVYVPRAQESDLGDLRLDGEARVVADSFARMLPREGELVSGVYDRLFTLAPDTRALFPEDLREQKAKLAHALKLAIDGLHAPERIVDMLRELGRRHGGYGVTPSHFESLGQALVATVREIDAEGWTDEVGRAWRRAYAFLSTAMRQGLAGAETTAVSESEIAVGVRPLFASTSTPPSAKPVSEPRASSPASGRGSASMPVAPTPLAIPRTQYAQNGDVSLAYQVSGAGPDLVVILGGVTHLELAYGHPSLADFLRALAGRFRVILVDKRGTGLSDRVLRDVTFEERVDDLRAVMDAAGSAEAALFGVADGGALAASFAVRFPSRVRGLATWASSARLLSGPGYDAGIEPQAVDAACATILARWGETFFAELEAPSMADDPAFAEWLAQLMRTAASPGNAVAMLKANASVDLRRDLHRLEVPALVMHRTGDRVSPIRGGRALAALLPNARFVELEGEDHVPFAGDVATVLRTLVAFLEALPGTGTRPRT